MKVKKYIGDSIQEAINRAKYELGDEIVVLNTQSIKSKGLFSFLKKPQYEVTVAQEKKQFIESSDTKSEDIYHIKEELEDLKKLLIEMPASLEKKDKDLHQDIKKYQRILVSNGVDFDIAYRILKDISDDLDIESKDQEIIEGLVKHQIKKVLGSVEPISVGDEQKVVFFVGPTGVGKTTTLAKIASSLVMENKYDVGLITSDTYRVGAVEQLKIYADILNLELEIAYSNQDMKESYEVFKNKDIILVDTAGRNHNSKEQTDELKEILSIEKNSETYLLISGTSDIRNLESLVNKYNFLGEYKIIVTKLDESNNYGSLLNISYLFDKKISYYTIGQNVPEDIRIMDVDHIADNLVKER